MKKLFLLGFILFSSTSLLFSQVGFDPINNVDEVTPKFATGLGTGNTSTGYYSFIGGSNSFATGSHSFGFGYKVKATADYSFVIGRSSLSGAIADYFVNDTWSSLKIGFGTPSSQPSLMITGVGQESKFSPEYYGYVGIFTDNPQNELDVNGTISTTGFVMPQLGVQEGYVLTATGTDGTAEWRQLLSGGSGGESLWAENPSNNNIYYYNGLGNVGIGSNANPTAKLHVFGSIKSTSYYQFDNADGVLVYGKHDENSSFKIQRAKSDLSGKSEDPYYWKDVLVIDNEERIGIGTDTPDAELDVNGKTKTQELQIITSGSSAPGYVLTDLDGNGNAVWSDIGSVGGGNDPVWIESGDNVYRQSGNVGIGVVNPVAPLHVKPNLNGPGFKFLNGGDVNSPSDYEFQANGTPGDYSTLKTHNSNWGTNYSWTCGSQSDGDVLGMELSIRPYKQEGTGYYTSTHLQLNGRMGINSPVQPGHTLSVNGTIGCKKVVVTLDDVDWPDFVFSDDYKLPVLSDIETYVNENKHLPGVPTAAEVKENGQDLGEMNAILLQKIEELTLLMIAQQKEIDALKKQVNQ